MAPLAPQDSLRDREIGTLKSIIMKANVRATKILMSVDNSLCRFQLLTNLNRERGWKLSSMGFRKDWVSSQTYNL